MFVLVVGGLVGMLLDQIHVRGGALAYPHPTWLDQPWWVAPQFGIAFMIGAALGLLLQRRRDPRRRELPDPGRIATDAGWFLASYVLTGALWEQPWMLTALLTGMLVGRMVRRRPDALTVGIMVLLAIAGTGWEGLLASVPDTFSYADPQLGTVPVWLPLLYVHSAPLVRELLVVGARFVWPDPATVDGRR